MLAVTHTLISLPIGAHVQSAPFAFGLAFLVHLFADTLLHWNIYVDRHRWPYLWVALDVGTALLLAYWLVPDRFFTPPMLAAIIGGNLPDIAHGLPDLLRTIQKSPRPQREFWFFRFHHDLQNETLNPLKGLVWQVVLCSVAVWTLR